MSDLYELWTRADGDGRAAFRWMVWRPDGSLGGDCSWFQNEVEARCYLASLTSSAAVVSANQDVPEPTKEPDRG